MEIVRISNDAPWDEQSYKLNGGEVILKSDRPLTLETSVLLLESVKLHLLLLARESK